MSENSRNMVIAMQAHQQVLTRVTTMIDLATMNGTASVPLADQMLLSLWVQDGRAIGMLELAVGSEYKELYAAMGGTGSPPEMSSREVLLPYCRANTAAKAAPSKATPAYATPVPPARGSMSKLFFFGGVAVLVLIVLAIATAQK